MRKAKKSHKHYTFKRAMEAVELANSIGISKASKELKISYSTLYKWVKKLNVQTTDADVEETEQSIDAFAENICEAYDTDTADVDNVNEEINENYSETIEVDSHCRNEINRLIAENKKLRHERDILFELVSFIMASENKAKHKQLVK